MVFCAGHVDRRAFFPLAVAFSFFAIAPVAAQEPRAEQSNVLHFAFASQVGSGVYAVNDRTVQIYRIPVGVRLPEVDPGWGWKLTLPVTLGFFDFEPQDFLAADVREHLSTVSFVPGLRFELPVRENIRLEPFAEGGMAWDLSGDTRTWVYAMGLASEIKFPWHDLDGRLGNRLLWAGITGDGQLLADDYGELETGLELSRPLWFSIHGRPVDAGLFAMSYLYFEPLEAYRTSDFEMRAQWEVGFTFGTRPPFAHKKIAMPRIGLSYRFGDGLSAARIVLGAPF